MQAWEEVSLSPPSSMPSSYIWFLSYSQNYLDIWHKTLTNIIKNIIDTFGELQRGPGDGSSRVAVIHPLYAPIIVYY